MHRLNDVFSRLNSGLYRLFKLDSVLVQVIMVKIFLFFTSGLGSFKAM